jgi:5'-nucleotidase
MNFLLTNDDGVSAPGIWAAARALSKFGTVLIVAPSANCSGYGTAFPPGQTPPFRPYTNGSAHPSGVTAYGLDASPATCANAGLSGVFGGAQADMVVSGINWGSNMGHDVFYSGTVGAALTAQLMGVPSIAISLDVPPNATPNWGGAEWALGEAVKMALTQHEIEPLMFNVNVPNRPAMALRGLQLTTFSTFSFMNRARFMQDPERPGNLKLIATNSINQPEAGSDAWAVQKGYASVTPIQPMPELMRIVPWVNTDAIASVALPYES